MNKSKSQSAADKRWIEKNKDHANYLRSRTAARSFIRTKATSEDLNELETLIREREKILKTTEDSCNKN